MSRDVDALRDHRPLRVVAAWAIESYGVVSITKASPRPGHQGGVGRVTHRPIRLIVITQPGQEAVFGAAAFQAQHAPLHAKRMIIGVAP